MDNQEPTIIDLSAKRYAKQQSYEGRQKFLLNQMKRSTHGAYRSDEVYPERLRMAREMFCSSQEAWSERLGIDLATYQSWEEGTAKPTVEQLNNIVETTGMFTVGWFCQPVNSGFPKIEETSLRFH